MNSSLPFSHLAALPPWEDAFPEWLETIGCREALPPSFRERRTYSTARVLLNRADAPRNVITIISVNGDNQPNGMAVELLLDQLADQLEPLSLVCASGVNSDRLQTLNRSVARYANCYPGITSSLRSLVRSLHVLQVEDDDYDVSHSFPNLPFSIFLSIPATARADACARVFESLLHETMHLQLSLLERAIPLIGSSNTQLLVYSPWRKEYRPPGGILHAMYVFRVIERFWTAVLADSRDEFEQRIAKSRCADIGDEFAQIRGFDEHPALTAAGRELVQALAK